MSDPRVARIQKALHQLDADQPPVGIVGPVQCCGDPKNLDGGAHPWQHVSEDGPGDVYVCSAGCGATDVD